MVKVLSLAVVRTGSELPEPIICTLGTELSSFGFFQRPVSSSLSVCPQSVSSTSLNTKLYRYEDDGRKEGENDAHDGRRHRHTHATAVMDLRPTMEGRKKGLGPMAEEVESSIRICSVDGFCRR
jgi:hypothetical protein